jgi:hypothetical protein
MLAWAEELSEHELNRKRLWSDLTGVYNNAGAKRDWFAEGAIEGNPLILFSGPEKSHKSWSAMQLAVATVLGGEWLERFPVRKPGTVVYLDGEYGEYEFTRRVARIARGVGADPESVFDKIYHRHSIDVTLKHSDMMLNSIMHYVGKYRPALVVIDPVRNHLDGDENEAHVVLAAFQALARLKTIGRCPMLLIHHLNKSGKFSGSRAFTTRADLIIEGSDKETPVYSAKGRTLRQGVDPLAEPFTIEVEHVNDEDDRVAATRLVYAGVGGSAKAAVKPSQPEGLSGKILELLNTRSEPLSVNGIATELGRSAADIKHELEALQTKGLVESLPFVHRGQSCTGWCSKKEDQ